MKIGSQNNIINIIILLIVLKVSINRIMINQIYDLIIKKRIDLYINIKRFSFYNLDILFIKNLKFINFNNLFNIKTNHYNQINAQTKIRDFHLLFFLNLNPQNFKLSNL